MQVGSLGDIVFEVSKDKTFTFDSLSTTVGGEYAEHKIIYGKARKQHMGASNKEASLSILLRADLGIKPADMISELEAMAESGKAARLIIGGRPIGANPYVITSVSTAYSIIYGAGEIMSAKIDIKLEEYT